jgi:hypothetical protein
VKLTVTEFLLLQSLAQRGLTFGMHLLVAAARWADFRSAMRDIFGTRLELRLGDPLDSEIDRKVAQLVPTGRPGRGIMVGKVHFLGALPRVDSSPDPSNLGDGIEDFVKRSAAAWTGPTGPKLRLLPSRIALVTVREQAEAAGVDDKRLLLGINEKELAPVGLDQASEPHLLVLGDGQSGKSALLRSVVQEIVRTKTAKEAQQTSMLVSMLPLMVGMMFTMRQSLNPGAWPLAWELKALAGPLLGSTSAVAPFPLVAGVELAAAALILVASARRVRSESVLG